MQNANAKIDAKGILTITIDTNKTVGDSSSGKTTLYASSRGNANIGSDKKGNAVMVGLNVFRYKDK